MLSEYGIDVSTSTVYRTLKQNNYTFKKLRRVASERDEDRRLAFLLEIGRCRPDQLVFMDECRKDERIEGLNQGWSKSGTTAVIKQVFNRGRS